ncbi:N-acetylmuramoyl-L-alanine amidase [Gordonibacter sp. 28C]|uniref:N-acetylmuramoyl-L-alanine amidase n=1 Tax=Gordonibacter sp. 28C TaxID=2078569 RepID=UPI0013149387|nr:N-acetylmuramoyl-L-alanine amidase [Gordonibacter sp. 28C]
MDAIFHILYMKYYCELRWRMNMNLPKKMMSVLMGVVLAFGLNPVAVADAAEEDSLEQQQALTDESAEVFPPIDNNLESHELIDQREIISDSQNALAENAVKSDSFDKDIASVIEFIYVDLQVASYGDTQLFAVSLLDSAVEISHMSIKIVDEESNVYFLDALSYAGGAASFEMHIEEGMLQGAYRITEINYLVKDDATEYSILVPSSEKGAYGFTVLPEGALGELDDAEIVESEESVTVFTIDDNGSLTEKDTVGGALAAAQSSSVSVFSARMQTGNIVVALDPGHGIDPNTGVYDPGASANGIVEADVNELIARYCKEELGQYFGVTVLLVPRYRSVNDRVDWAVANGANVYVSLHNNSATAGAYGFEIYVPNESNFNHATHVVGTQLAQKIARRLAELGLYDRGIKYRDSENVNGSGPFYYDDGHLADYYSAIERSRQNGIAGIIVEHAFVTNATDAAFLASEGNLRSLGIADAKAIAEQYGLLKVSEEQYKGVYDYEYYISHNPDVNQAFGADKTAVFKHFIEFGMMEGRQGSDIFDPIYYKSTYSDVAYAFGSEMSKYYTHFISFLTA